MEQRTEELCSFLEEHGLPATSNGPYAMLSRDAAGSPEDLVVMSVREFQQLLEQIANGLPD